MKRQAKVTSLSGNKRRQIGRIERGKQSTATGGVFLLNRIVSFFSSKSYYYPKKKFSVSKYKFVNFACKYVFAN